MRILRHFKNVPKGAKGGVAALGNFDGVHRGHQALIAEAGRRAKEARAPLLVIVFEPYPREYFRPTDPPFRLTSFHTKARLLQEQGVDWLIVLPFDAKLAAMLAQDFVLDILKAELAVRHVVVGEDFRFGKGRGGDASVLSYMGAMEDFGVTVFPPLADGPVAKISSSRIRESLMDGKPEEAARLLGHYWSIEGRVAAGDQRGRTIGYPTANLTLEDTMLPAHGVYAVRVYLGGDPAPYLGMANFGRRPTYEVKSPLFEVNLFDFNRAIYGEVLRAELVAYLRSEKKFDGLTSLAAALGEDAIAARRMLAAA